MRRLIGLDLDNTIIRYDRALGIGAGKVGVPAELADTGKKRIRDWLRSQPAGEQRWMELQAYLYGPGLAHAEAAPGVLDFLAACARVGQPVCVVSHKSEFAAAAPEGTNMRDAALDWLEANGFFALAYGLARERVYFEFTRAAKVAKVAALGCAVFVDDLEETFLEPGFPEGVRRILYDPADSGADDARWERVRRWDEVTKVVE